MNIIIMGSGRVGARLARLFDRDGHDVTVIDTNPQAFERLDFDFTGRTVVGTGIDEDVLKRAGIEHADVFLAVTNLDNPNIMASQIAKLMFKVPRVVARIYDPAREDTYHDLGLETICPTTLVSQRIHQAVVTNSADPLDDHEIEPLDGSLPPTRAVAADAQTRAFMPAVTVNSPAPAPIVTRPIGNGSGNGTTVASNRHEEPAAQQRSSQGIGLRRFFR